jgi:hypothetical protein
MWVVERLPVPTPSARNSPHRVAERARHSNDASRHRAITDRKDRRALAQ